MDITWPHTANRLMIVYSATAESLRTPSLPSPNST